MIKKTVRIFHIFTCFLLVLATTGCAPLLLGSGKSATKEDTGFLASYNELQEGKLGLPDYFYKDQNVNWSKYKIVAVTDYSSLATNPNSNSALQMSGYKNLRQDLADTMCNGLDGTFFSKCRRIQERLDPKDKSELGKILADVILMGNIKELKSIGGLTVAQLEIKIIEKKSGKEIFQMIDRQTTDPDKVAMPSLRKVMAVLNSSP